MHTVLTKAGGEYPDTIKGANVDHAIPQNRATRRLLVDSIGPKGSYITNTSANALTDGKYWRFIYAHEDAVISTATSLADEDSVDVIAGTLSSIAIPKGSLYSCAFTSFTLASGKVTAYQA